MNHSTSALLSSLLTILIFAMMQAFRGYFAGSKLSTLLGGFFGANIFVFSLTAISNVEAELFSPSFQAKIFPEVIISLALAVLSSMLVHRVCVTVWCMLWVVVFGFAVVALFLPFGAALESSGLHQRLRFGEAASQRHVDLTKLCSTNKKCSELGASCLTCEFPANCKYGQSLRVMCHPKANVTCKGSWNVERNGMCTFCFLADPAFYKCRPVYNCSSTAPPLNRMVKTLCFIDESFVCLGRRRFYKKVPCNWTRGYKWWKALLLSITLGGFGVDRFYLGLWRSGVGKLFSFGGIGVWTIVDVILIATGYVGPSDSSVYM